MKINKNIVTGWRGRRRGEGRPQEWSIENIREHQPLLLTVCM